MEENEIIKEQMCIYEIIFCLYFIVMFGAKSIGLYEGQLLYNICLVIGVALFLVKLLLTKHSFKEYLIVSFLILLSLVIYYNTGEKGLLIYMTLMIGMKGLSRKLIERLGFFILSISFILITFTTSIGLIVDKSYRSYRAFFGEILRHCLGYPVHNTTMTVYIILMMLFFSVVEFTSVKKVLKWSLFLGTVSLLLFIATCSNTGIIVSVFYLSINLYMTKRGKLNKVDKIIGYMAYPLGLIIGIVLPAITMKMNFLNGILSQLSHNRWRLSQYYLENEPITLFGVRFKQVFEGSYAYMIDSSFLYSFMQLGIIGFILITFLNVVVIHHLIKEERKVELAIVISHCLLGLSDPFLFNLSYKNLMFLYIGEWFWKQMNNVKIIDDKKNAISYFIGRIDVLVERCMLHVWEVGEKTISIIRWNELHIKFKKYVEEVANGPLLIVGSVLIIIVSIIAVLITKSTYLVGRPDTIEEWESLRRVVAYCFWSISTLCVGYSFYSRK